jgi:hypothetical protein
MNENKNKELDRLNGVYKKLLAGAEVEFIEGFGKVIDGHTVEVSGKRYTVTPPPPPLPPPLASRWCQVQEGVERSGWSWDEDGCPARLIFILDRHF